ncbi:MAG: iron ABC transporter permease [Abitibacteriaceae bacterium]|nr:iron ABC transporter permease [Abditibacteriaceae bacterium]
MAVTSDKQTQRFGVSLRWLLLLGLFVVVVLLAATLGAPVPLSDLWASDTDRVAVARQIFLQLRPPRLLAGMLVGASLATSGAALQAVFRNPLAEPYLLGISAGGALGATAALAWHLPSFGVFESSSLLAFAGSLAAAFLVYRLGQGRVLHGFGSFDRATLLLIGVALSAFLSALMSLLVTLSPDAGLAQKIMFWLLGGLTLARMSNNGILALALGVGMATMLASARDLNATQVGDEEAASLGVSIGTLHRRLLLVSALMSSAAVATAGLIGFVGLLAPHLVRLLFGNDARALGPAAAIGGATLLVGCDALARSVAPPLELPVGIITALLGVPLFLFLAKRA